MNVNVRDFIGYSVNHGYIKIVNCLDLNKVLWEGKFETPEHYIPSYIAKSNVEKWGIENNGIVIYIKYKKIEIEDMFKDI